jgi:hypothetical protein
MNGDLIDKLNHGQAGGSVVTATRYVPVTSSMIHPPHLGVRLDASLRCFPFSCILDGEDVIPALHGYGKTEKKNALLALRGAAAGDILDELQLVRNAPSPHAIP